jgi:D-glycero-D-manno-heptose 1,7-bisphosphate phosphatase
MKAVFLDRDGVITVDLGYVHLIEDLKLLPGAVEAIKRFNAAGFLVVIVTNQSGVARGYYTENAVKRFNRHLVSELKEHGAKIDAVYYCPHHREGAVKKYMKDCDCRKPKPGMLLRAAREHCIDLKGSWMVGDKVSDVLAGKAAGCRTIIIGGRKGEADGAAKDLKAAAAYILGRRLRRAGR